MTLLADALLGWGVFNVLLAVMLVPMHRRATAPAGSTARIDAPLRVVQDTRASGAAGK
jgi:hypothetical protein